MGLSGWFLQQLASVRVRRWAHSKMIWQLRGLLVLMCAGLETRECLRVKGVDVASERQASGREVSSTPERSCPLIHHAVPAHF